MKGQGVVHLKAVEHRERKKCKLLTTNLGAMFN